MNESNQLLLNPIDEESEKSIINDEKLVENNFEIEDLQDYFNNSSDETNQLILHNNNEDIVDFLG